MKIGYRDWFAERCPQHCNIIFGSVGAAIAVGSAAAGVAGSVISSNAQNKASKRAAAAQKDASDQQIALTREQMEYAKGIARPYQEAGAAADLRLRQLWDNPKAAAYDGRPSPRPMPASVYGAGGGADARLSIQGAGGRPVAQVGVPQRAPLPAPPAPPAPYQSPVPAGWTPSKPIGAYVPPAPPAPPPAPPPTLSPTPWVPGGWRPDPRVFNVQKL